MSVSIRDLLTQEDCQILISVLEKEYKHCLAIANRPTQGYGSCAEKEKKSKWRQRAEDVRELESKIMNEMI